MITRLYTDVELDALRTMPKHVRNPRARWLKSPRRNLVTASEPFVLRQLARTTWNLWFFRGKASWTSLIFPVDLSAFLVATG